MTIKEFYEWAVKNGAEDFEVRIQYRDGGGYYCGHDYLDGNQILIDQSTRTVMV